MTSSAARRVAQIAQKGSRRYHDVCSPTSEQAMTEDGCRTEMDHRKAVTEQAMVPAVIAVPL
jgi:hypothetical protein